MKAEKAEVLVNRHVVAANKKHHRDDPAISVNTSAGAIYGKTVEATGTIRLIQDADHPRACGATIWIEAKVEDLIVDGRPCLELVQEKKAQKTARKQQRRQASEHSSKPPEQLTFIN